MEAPKKKKAADASKGPKFIPCKRMERVVTILFATCATVRVKSILCDFKVGEIELGLIQTQMAQKPVLRAEVYARALRASEKLERERRYRWARDVPDEWAR